jgi:AcrR family transcriptional regulator
VGQIVEAAGLLLAQEGPDALTMRRLADRLDIKAPSLYKHLSGRPALVALVVEDALFELGDHLHTALDQRRDPVAALLGGYRRFGLDRPQLYRLATSPDLPRDLLLPGLEEWAGEPFYRAAGEPHLAQALWSYAHGMLILELDRRFYPGSDLDRTWRAGARAFTAARPS